MSTPLADFRRRLDEQRTVHARMAIPLRDLVGVLNDARVLLDAYQQAAAAPTGPGSRRRRLQ